jgi:hypothetical protein
MLLAVSVGDNILTRFDEGVSVGQRECCGNERIL